MQTNRGRRRKGLFVTRIQGLYYWNIYKISSYRRPCMTCLSHVLVSHKFHCVSDIFMPHSIGYSCFALILVNMAENDREQSKEAIKYNTV